MNGLLGWVLACVSGVFIEAELIAWCGPLQRGLLRLASMRLNTSHRARYREEWLGELKQVPAGPLTRMLFVMSLLVRAHTLESAVDEELIDALGVTNHWYLRHERHLDEVHAFNSAIRLEARRRRDGASASDMASLLAVVHALGWSRRFRRALQMARIDAIYSRRFRLWESRPQSWWQVFVAWSITLRRLYFVSFTPLVTPSVQRSEIKDLLAHRWMPSDIGFVRFSSIGDITDVDRETVRRWRRSGDMRMWVFSGHRYVSIEELVDNIRDDRASRT